MKFIKAIAVAALIAGSSASNATLILPGSETPLQQVICNLYAAAGTPCANAPDVNADQYGPDELWQIGGSGGSLATFIIQIAGLANQSEFGIYDATAPGSKVTLFDGSSGLTAGDQVLVSILNDGSVRRNFVDTGIDFAGNKFGYFLRAGNTTFYSQAALNGGSDQMVAFQGDGDMIRIGNLAAGPWGANEFILAWEDISYRVSDRDFNDFVVLVESVSGVPEPGSLALAGLALLAAAGMARRRTR
jgi:hypothetical protein